MTDTPPPPERQSEATRALDDLGELIDQLASNAREFDYNAANRMERDAAKALLTIEAAVNALPELLAKVKRLEEALNIFVDRPWMKCLSDDLSENHLISMDVRVADIRRASRALAALNQEPGQ
jgi:hypothetical protein